METFTLTRLALTISAAAALLAGCGGSQPPIGAPGAMRQGRMITTRAGHSGSWVLPEAKGQTLIYATDGCGGTCVLSYASGEVVGELDVGGGVSGACVDGEGNVYISNSTEVVEYAHGGTNSIATFKVPGTRAGGCSVDPTTGNLAVQFLGTSGNIAVFPKGSDTPTLYQSNAADGFACAYDEHGNLFASGFNNDQSSLTELPSGGSAFHPVSMPDVGFPGQIQWTAQDLAYETVGKGHTFVYRLSITGSTAAVVGKTHIVGPLWSFYSWIYNHKIIVPFAGHGKYHSRAQNVGVWSFPKGGRVIKEYKHFDDADFQAVVVSPG